MLSKSPGNEVTTMERNSCQKSVRTTLGDTLKFSFPLRSPSYTHKKSRKETLTGEDCTIAEEFYEDEQHIAESLAKRDAQKIYKLPRLASTPRSRPIGLNRFFMNEWNITCKAKDSKIFFRGKSSPKNTNISSVLIKKESSIVTQRKSYSKPRLKVKELIVETNIEKIAQKENIHQSEKSTSKRFNFDQVFRINSRRGPQMQNMCRAQPKVFIKDDNSMDTIDESLEHDNITTKRTCHCKRAIEI